MVLAAGRPGGAREEQLQQDHGVRRKEEREEGEGIGQRERHGGAGGRDEIGRALPGGAGWKGYERERCARIEGDGLGLRGEMAGP